MTYVCIIYFLLKMITYISSPCSETYEINRSLRIKKAFQSQIVIFLLLTIFINIWNIFFTIHLTLFKTANIIRIFRYYTVKN